VVVLQTSHGDVPAERERGARDDDLAVVLQGHRLGVVEVVAEMPNRTEPPFPKDGSRTPAAVKRATRKSEPDLLGGAGDDDTPSVSTRTALA
jgi:hypothetical protein